MLYQNKTKKCYLGTLLSQNVSHKAKFTALLLQNLNLSMNSEIVILIIEYLQLTSQIFLLALNLWSLEPSGSSFTVFVTSVLKLLNPGSLFISQGVNNTILSLLAISIVFSVCKYVSLASIIVCTLRLEGKPHEIFINMWKIIFHIQGRVLYSLVSSIWVSTIVLALQNGFTLPGLGKIGTLVLLVGFMTMELIFSVGLRLRYYTFLPTKSLLSSKSPLIGVITVSQKLFLQILQIIFASFSYMDGWVIRSVCVLFSVIRNMYYFKTLPLYNIKGLQLQGVMLMVLTSLDIACFFQKTRGQTNIDDALSFILIIWILLGLLMTKLCYAYINKTVLSLALGNNMDSPSKLIQKVNIIKQLRDCIVQSTSPREDTYLNLLNSTIDKNLFVDKRETNTDNPKNNFYQICVNYLKSAQVLFPKDDMLKLYIAELSAIKLQAYGTSIGFLNSLEHSPSHIIQINSALLSGKIQELMKIQSGVSKNKINIYMYLQAKGQYLQLQSKILQQTDLQRTLYQEMAKESPDLSRIFNQAQAVDKWRRSIVKETDIILKNIPEHHIKPVLVCAYYNLILNHSPTDYSKYLKIYSQRKTKYAKNFECEDITSENYHQENNAMLLVSGQKESLGKIVFCTDSFARIYGSDINLYIGADISTIAPLNAPCFGSLFSKLAGEKESRAVLGNGFRGYCKHKKEYLIEAEFYIDIFPFITNGFYYCILIRPISAQKNLLILDREGVIIGASQRLRKVLYLDHSAPSVNVSSISGELAQINQTFGNGVLSKKAKENEEKLRLNSKEDSFIVENKDDNVFSVSIQGQEVKLTPLQTKINAIRIDKEGQKGLIYDWKITLLTQEPHILSLVTLQEKIHLHTGNANEKEAINMLDAFKESEDEPSISDIEDIGTEREGNNDQINSTRWDLKKDNLAITRRNESAKENKIVDLLISERSLTSPTTRFLLKQEETPRKIEGKYVKEKLFSVDSQDEYRENHKRDPNIIEDETVNKVAFHTSQEKISLVLKAALVKKYSWRPLKITYIMFYLLLLSVMIEQLILKNGLDETITDLKAKKDILNNAQLRDYSLVVIARVSWFVVTSAAGSFNASAVNTFGQTLKNYYLVMNPALTNLISANSNIQVNAGSVDESLRGTLFEQDIKLYKPTLNGDSEATINMTTLQATDFIAQIVMKAATIAKNNLSQSVDLYKFLVFNTLNDLLVKTESITELFTKSISEDTEQKKKLMEATFIIFTIGLIVMSLALVKVIFEVYAKEKLNMHTLIKLDSAAISKLNNRLDTFRKLLETGSFTENKGTLRAIQTSISAEFQQRFKNRINLQSPKHSGIIKKYFIYAIRSLFFSCIIIGLMAWSSFSASNSIESLQEQHSRLIFSSNLAKTVALAYLGYQLLYANDSMMEIRSEPVASQFEKVLDTLIDMRNEVIRIFQNDGGGYDSLIGGLLFDNNCKNIITLTTSVNYCAFLQKRQQNIGLVSLLSNYEGIIQGLEVSYYSSNKSLPVLQALQAQYYDILLAYQRVILDESTTITNRTNVIFNEKFNNAKSQAGLILSLLLVMLVVLSYLGWIWTFRPLVESDNRFKIVLKNYPANLVLSNFLLKKFLIMTSGSALDSIRSLL